MGIFTIGLLFSLGARVKTRFVVSLLRENLEARIHSHTLFKQTYSNKSTSSSLVLASFGT